MGLIRADTDELITIIDLEQECRCFKLLSGQLSESEIPYDYRKEQVMDRTGKMVSGLVRVDMSAPTSAKGSRLRNTYTNRKA